MKTLIIYTSQTGFTKKYAGWLAEKMSGDLIDLKEAQKKDDGFFGSYDDICYGGWAMAEMIASSYDISDIKYLEPIISYLGE